MGSAALKHKSMIEAGAAGVGVSTPRWRINPISARRLRWADLSICTVQARGVALNRLRRLGAMEVKPITAQNAPNGTWIFAAALPGWWVPGASVAAQEVRGKQDLGSPDAVEQTAIENSLQIAVLSAMMMWKVSLSRAPLQEAPSPAACVAGALVEAAPGRLRLMSWSSGPWDEPTRSSRDAAAGGRSRLVEETGNLTRHSRQQQPEEYHAGTTGLSRREKPSRRPGQVPPVSPMLE